MTWQGGKTPREGPPAPSPFARLSPLVSEDRTAELDGSLQELARALKRVKTKHRLHLRLITEPEGEAVDHWEVGDGKARRNQPKNPDVIVIMHKDTWMEIAQGKLAPYDALLGGKLRVGVDFEAAKEMVRQLTDPSAPYVPPC
jgi:putative sterol carrier protein